MTISVLSTGRIPMSQKDRDVLKIMHAVLRGKHSQAEAVRLLDKSVRQVRRIQQRLQADGDQALVHGLSGRPSNHQPDADLRLAVVTAYRQRYADFGPIGRTLRELGVELIRAHSPQAKGRIERSFGTAQDRWVKDYFRLTRGRKIVDKAERQQIQFGHHLNEAPVPAGHLLAPSAREAPAHPGVHHAMATMVADVGGRRTSDSAGAADFPTA
jgi:Helix-turn-helix domain